MPAAKFAERIGVKYSTFATWAHQRRKERGCGDAVREQRSGPAALKWVEAVRLQAEVDVGQADTLTAQAVIEEALKLQDLWPTLDLERKRQIVQSLVQSITVDVDAQRITLVFTCLPSSEETTNTQQRL